jgi:hypothetical protein
MRIPKKFVPVSAAVLTLPIGLSLALAPVAAATPHEEHCARVAKEVDALDPHDGSLYAQRVIATYQIECKGSASPSNAGRLGVHPLRTLLDDVRSTHPIRAVLADVRPEHHPIRDALGVANANAK